jgi:signal transduction histidine kinase
MESSLGLSKNPLVNKPKEMRTMEIDHYRSDFINMASHELRTSLQIIKGYVEILESGNGKFPPKEKKRCFELLNKNISRLEHFVEIMSEIDLIEQGAFKLRLDDVNIGDLLDIVLHQYKMMLGDQFTFLKSKEIGEELIIKVDSERFAHTLDCIIQNAIEHTPVTQRKIVVSYTFLDSSNSISIKISDNGAGIAFENMEKIKQPFVSIPSKYSVGGIGVGLYLSRVIVEKHKGTLSIESAGLGKGTTIEIKIPGICKSETQPLLMIE